MCDEEMSYDLAYVLFLCVVFLESLDRLQLWSVIWAYKTLRRRYSLSRHGVVLLYISTYNPDQESRLRMFYQVVQVLTRCFCIFRVIPGCCFQTIRGVE